MPNYLAQGLNVGFQTGARAYDDKVRRQLQEDALELTAKRYAADKELRSTMRQNEIEKNRRFLGQQKFEREELARLAAEKANDPREQLAIEKARRELEALRNPAPAATAPAMPAPPPTARVKQAFGPGGKSTAEYEVPVSELDQLRQSNPASSYRSPYDRDIAELARQEAAQQAEIATGDKRTGFLNWQSREDLATKASTQRLRLEAMRLQDMVAKGVISQEEADERADALMAQYR